MGLKPWIEATDKTLPDLAFYTHTHAALLAGERFIRVRMQRSARLEWKLLHI